jgi:hypothetical protein
MNATRALRVLGAVTALGGAMLVAPDAGAAGPYAIDASIVSGGGGQTFQYSPSSFHWNETFEVSFTHTTDSTSAALMALAQTPRRDLGSAIVHESLNGTAVITLAMSGVHVDFVHEDGSVNNSNGPEETVVLRFRSITYTYQPVTPTGQRAGAPVSFTYTRGGWDGQGR